MGDDDEIQALLDMQRRAIETVEEVRATRTRLLALRPEHEAVDRQRVLVRREELGELEPSRPTCGALALEDIVLGDLAALGQGATLRRHALDMPAQFHLFLQERVAR